MSLNLVKSTRAIRSLLSLQIKSHGADMFQSSTSNSLFYTATYGVSAKLLSKILDISNETLHSNHTQVPGGVLWSFAFEPLPTQVTKFGPSKGGNSLGTTPADGNGVSEYTRHTPLLQPNSASDTYETRN